MPEYRQPELPEGGNSPERQAPLALDALPTQLGLVETPQMMDLRENLIEALAEDQAAATELVAQYHRLAETAVERHSGADYGKAQIALIIAMGLIWRDAGHLEEYAEELEAARMYADYESLSAVVQTLDAAIDQARS